MYTRIHTHNIIEYIYKDTCCQQGKKKKKDFCERKKDKQQEKTEEKIKQMKNK